MKYIKTTTLITYANINDFNKESFANSIAKSEYFFNTKYAFGIRILNNVTSRFDILPFFTYLQISSIKNEGDFVNYIDNMYIEMYNSTSEFLKDPYYNKLEDFSIEIFTFKCFYRKKSDFITE